MHTWIVAVIFSVGAAAGAQTTTGKVTRVDGNVWLQLPGKAETTATVGVAVSGGTAIRTAPAAVAEVAFDDGSTFQILGGSRLQMSANKRQKPKNSIVLFFGKLWSKVTHASGSDTNYEIKTPNAVCGVRGTEFTTHVADDGSVRVHVNAGQVALDGDGSSAAVEAGQQADADDGGVSRSQSAQGDSQNRAWQEGKRERLNQQSGQLVGRLKHNVQRRKEQIAALRDEENTLEQRVKALAARVKEGDEAAAKELQEAVQSLARVADAIADTGDQVASQFGLVDHFADLARDPRFGSIDRKTLEAEASSLRRIKADLDKMVADGTDISIEAMDKMMQDMHDQRGTLKEKKGSSAKELFDDDKAQ